MLASVDRNGPVRIHFGGFVLLYSIIGCLTEELTLEILYTL